MAKAKVVESGLKNSLGPKDEEPQDYEVKDAVSTLERAEEIKKDKRLMPHVHKHIAKKIHSLKDLRSLANDKHMEEDAEDEAQKSAEKKEFKGNIDVD